MLIVDGTELNGRHLVVLDGNPIYLTHAVFMCLLRLASKRGWVDKYEIEPNGNAGRYLHLLRNESGGRIQVENDSNGCYRLGCKARLNLLALFKLEDYEIEQLCSVATKKPGG